MFTTEAPQSLKDPVSRLIYELTKLPGIGEKTATRLAYHILKQDPAYAKALSDALTEAKRTIHLCGTCFNFTNQETCAICSDFRRNQQIICVVERPSDVLSLEQSGVHHGVYHVLHGALSPLDGIGPDELKIRELLRRVSPTSGEVTEVILATNPSVEGEATAIYLTKLLKPLGIRLTQLAYGLPMGGMLEYADKQTISRAMENRVEIL